jgi:uncharacterized C2H2 Zn-finger protein
MKMNKAIKIKMDNGLIMFECSVCGALWENKEDCIKFCCEGL